MPNWKWLDFKLLLILVVLGGGSCWELWEQDIFWQIKAGRELIDSFSFPTADSWSFSAVGQPWRNHQWLATILLNIFSWPLASPIGLIGFRIIIVLGILLLIHRFVIERGGETLFSFCILTLSFVTLAERLQLRSELFVLPIVFLLRTRGQNGYQSILKDFLLVLLSVQLHPGVAPFAAVAVFLRRFEASSTEPPMLLRSKSGIDWSIALAAALSVAALWINPYPSFTFSYLFDHLNYSSQIKLRNPEHEGLLSALAQGASVGLGYWLFVGVSCLTLYSCKVRRSLGLGIAYLGLIALCILKSRAVPFVYLLVLPEFVGVGKSLWKAAPRKQIGVLVFHISLLLAHVGLFKRPLGWGLNNFSYPVGALNFLEKSLAPKMEMRELRMFHSPSTGNYILSSLHKIPVFIDTREMMYKDVQVDFRSVGENADKAKEVFDRYGINSVLLSVYFIVGNSQTASEAREREVRLVPPENWALVYTDEDYALYLERSIVSRLGLTEWTNPYLK